MTVGWIHEGATDRFLAATDPFPRVGRPTVTIACPFCGDRFVRQPELHAHVALRHSVERPALVIGGIEPGRQFRIRRPLDTDALAVTNATSIQVGAVGEPKRLVSAAELALALSQSRYADLDIVLRNARQENAIAPEVKYLANMRVADVHELSAVEQAFAEHIVGNQQLSIRAVATFRYDGRSTSGAAEDYAQGLAEYCLGVLIKERPETQILTTPYAEYRDKYGAALDCLKDIDRPLAQLVVNIVRFVANDFATGSVGIARLDTAIALLRAPSAVSQPVDVETIAERKPICPVDHGTSQVLDLAASMLTHTRWSPILGVQCQSVAESQLLDETDRQKACAIWALTAWRLDARESAKRPLERIAAVYPFDGWAGAYLEALSR